MLRMALMLGALAVAALGSAQPSLAGYEGPWCAHRQMGGGFVDNNCGMMSYEQCRANIFATGGAWCMQNPRYIPQPVPVRRKAKRRPR
jgi:hypothetical protein